MIKDIDVAEAMEKWRRYNILNDSERLIRDVKNNIHSNCLKKIEEENNRLKTKNWELEEENRRYKNEVSNIRDFVKSELDKLPAYEIYYGYNEHTLTELKELIKSLHVNHVRIRSLNEELECIDNLINQYIRSNDPNCNDNFTQYNGFRKDMFKKMIKLVQDKSYQKGHKDWKKNYEELWDKMQKVVNEA